MTRRVLASFTLAALLAGIASLPVAGQSSSAPPLVITAYNGGEPFPYPTPRTPWGDPDLQGTWSSDDTEGIPVSRPANVTGMWLNEEQWAARQKNVQAGITRNENAVGSFRGDFARRAFRQTSQVIDPADGRIPQPTAEARKRAAPRDRGTFGDGPFDWTTDFTLYDRCITRGIWGSVQRVIYGNGNRITQAPGMVAISYEMVHDTRIIYTDGRSHINDGIRQYLGSSRGRWEGDELVVETTNLTDQTSIGANGNGLRHSDKVRITERIKRVAEDVLQYQVTVDDPVTYGVPFTMSIPLTPLDGGVLLPYDCHEGNEAVRNSLGAERAEDRALAADLSKGIVRPRRGVQESGVGGGGGGGRGRGAGAGAAGAPAGGRGAPPAGPPADGDQER